VRIRPLRPFGVEIAGVEVSAATPTAIAELGTFVSRYRVGVIRDQQIDDAAFVAFLRALGELTFTAGETPVAGAPDLNLISNVGRSTPPRSVFHTDTSYVARPPAFTALRTVRLPRAGGTTLFSDQVRAAATLPARIRAALSGRTVRHGLAAAGAEGSQRHPLFRRHPVTHEVALFLSTPERCTELSGLDEATSTRAIDALYRHSIRPTRLYCHSWRAGDIVIWDDRLTMHRADHTDVDGDRVLHRGLVLGEVPIPA
jgi:taurine dioxygenase